MNTQQTHTETPSKSLTTGKRTAHTPLTPSCNVSHQRRKLEQENDERIEKRSDLNEEGESQMDDRAHTEPQRDIIPDDNLIQHDYCTSESNGSPPRRTNKTPSVITGIDQLKRCLLRPLGSTELDDLEYDKRWGSYMQLEELKETKLLLGFMIKERAYESEV